MADPYDPNDPPTVLKPGCWTRGIVLVVVFLSLTLGPILFTMWRLDRNLSRMMASMPAFLEAQGYDFEVEASGGKISENSGSLWGCMYDATFVVVFNGVETSDLDRIAGAIIAHDFESPETADRPTPPKVSVDQVIDRIDPQSPTLRVLVYMESGPWSGWRAFGC